MGRWLVVTIAALLLVSCPADTEEDPNERITAIYLTVLNDVVADSPVEPEDPEGVATLFIEAFDPEGLPLEVQVEIVADFVDRYDVRFIDDRVEATDIETPGTPVRPFSLFVGVGPIAGDDTADVRAERYFTDNDIDAYRYTLTEASEGSWSIVGTPEAIEPEGFAVSS